MRLAPLLLLLPAMAHAGPPCLTLAQAQEAAGAPKELSAKLTPPLPVSWPPSGEPAVRFYDFRSEPLPTGVVAYGVDSPSAELTVPLDGTKVKRRALGKRKRLGTFTPPIDPPARGEPAGQLLMQLVCEGRGPTPPEAAQLRASYGAWLRAEPLVRGWLALQSGPFVAWLSARPLPPPAPPGAKLTARIEGAAVILTRDGKDVRFERAGLSTSQLTVVPLRADGSDPALWVNLQDPQLGAVGLLVRYASPPQVVYTLVYSSNQPGISSTSRTAWLVDVDEDGFNDLVEHATGHSDVGTQNEGARVARYDPLLGVWSPSDPKLDRRVSPVSPILDSRTQKRVGKALANPRDFELRGLLDGHSVRLPAAPPPDGIGSGGTPPFAGPDGLLLVLVKKKGQPLGGQYHLVHVRYGKEPVVVSTVDLGGVGYPPNGCRGRQEEFRREAGAMVVVWPSERLELLEQRVPWDGETLGVPLAPPVKVGSCTGL